MWKYIYISICSSQTFLKNPNYYCRKKAGDARIRVPKNVLLKNKTQIKISLFNLGWIPQTDHLMFPKCPVQEWTDRPENIIQMICITCLL